MKNSHLNLAVKASNLGIAIEKQGPFSQNNYIDRLDQVLPSLPQSYVTDNRKIPEECLQLFK